MIARNTTSDVSSIKQLLSLVQLGIGVNTSHIYQTHVVGEPIVVGGADELQASPAEVAAVVDQFMNPQRPPVLAPRGESQPKGSFTVAVTNGGAPAGSAPAPPGSSPRKGTRRRSPATSSRATPRPRPSMRRRASPAMPASSPPCCAQPRDHRAARPGVQAGVTVALGPSYTASWCCPRRRRPVRRSSTTARRTPPSGFSSLIRPRSRCACHRLGARILLRLGDVARLYHPHGPWQPRALVVVA